MSFLHNIIAEQTKNFPAIPPLTNPFSIRLFQSSQYLYLLHPCDYEGEIAVWLCKYEKKAEQFALGPNSTQLIKFSQFPKLFTIFQAALARLNAGNYTFYLPIDFCTVDHLSSYWQGHLTLTLSHLSHPFAMEDDMNISITDSPMSTR